MPKSLRTGSIFLAALLLALSFTGARPAGAAQGPGRGPGRGPMQPGGGMRGEELRETIEIYMLAKMKTELQLTATQEQELVPLVQELSAARQRHRRHRRMTLMSLAPLVEDPATTDEALRGELDSLAGSQKAFRDSEKESMERIREILSPRQEARFVLFMERFMQDMQRRLRKMRQMHGDGGGPVDGRRRGEGRRRGGQSPGGP